MKTRIAVIGVGYLGKIHAAKFAVMDGVEFVGVADVNYYGNPKQIEKEILGVGNVNQME